MRVAWAALRAAARSSLSIVAISCPACTSSPSSTVSICIRPIMRELTTTSLASTVPINWRSSERRVEKKYQPSAITNSTPIRMKIRLRAFIMLSPDLAALDLGHRHLGQHTFRDLRTAGTVDKDSVAQELHCRLAPGFDRPLVEWVKGQRELHQGCAHEIENVGAEHA